MITEQYVPRIRMMPVPPAQKSGPVPEQHTQRIRMTPEQMAQRGRMAAEQVETYRKAIAPMQQHVAAAKASRLKNLLGAKTRIFQSLSPSAVSSPTA